MIKIKLKNVQEVVLQKRGGIQTKILGKFIDLEKEIEKQIIKQIKQTFADEGIEAEIVQE